MRLPAPFRRKALTADDAVKAITADPSILEALTDRRLLPFHSLGGTNLNTQRIGSVFVQHQSASYAYLYTHQPAVRTVVDYIARNIAQLGLKVYERISDDERRHVGDHPAARALRNPNVSTPGQQFIFDLVASFLIYDNAYVLKFKAPGSDKLGLMNVPPSAVGILGSQKFIAEGYRFYRADGTYFDRPASDVLHWRGYDPNEPRMGVSKLETLREELAADAAARTAKTELDRNGLAPRGWLERPVEAPPMSQEATERLRETWGGGGGAGTRLLEDGTEFKQSAVSPEQAQLLEARKLTTTQTDAIFGIGNVPPANEEERQQVINDVLQPYCEMLCAYLDLSILVGEFNADDYYTSFNLDEKRAGNDVLKALTSGSGVPPLTRNEARARMDLPPVEGGDEVITPLNVFAGDPAKMPKPSTGVMPIQDPNKPSQDGDHRTDPPKALEQKALPPDFQISVPRWEDRFKEDFNRQQRYIDQAQGVVGRMYKRQAMVLRKKSADGVDMERWNREHADDLFALLSSVVEREGGLYAARLAGIDFDLRFCQNYLKAQAEGAAEAMNDTTQEAIVAVGLEAAFDEVENERSDRLAVSLAVRSTLFARTTAAERFAPNPERRLKTWIMDTERHARYHGVSVPLDQDWGGLSPGSLPNCRCSFTIQ